MMFSFLASFTVEVLKVLSWTSSQEMLGYWISYIIILGFGRERERQRAKRETKEGSKERQKERESKEGDEKHSLV